MKQTILFQGDSITDCKRRETEDGLGLDGYVKQISNEDVFSKITNRGISGNGILDMFSRWQVDTLDVAPDVLSILIGVNDVLHELRDKNGVDEILFYDIYDTILKNTRRLLPDTEIILMSPFIFNNGNPNLLGFDIFSEKVEKLIHVVYELAKKYDLKYVPLQEIFNEKAKTYKEDELLLDGIHPTVLGHSIIKDAFLDVYKKPYEKTM